MARVRYMNFKHTRRKISWKLCVVWLKILLFFLVQTENSEVLDSDFNWEDFRDRSNAKQAGVIIGLIFGLIWPYIAWILLKLTGYAVIGMTFGHGHEFVSSTFFRWTDKMGNGFYKMILQQGGVCWCQLFYIASMALGCFLGYTFTSMTSLLTHNVAHFTRPSFRPKTNNKPNKKFLSLVVSWVKFIKTLRSFRK